jgi:hypothetical protein
MDIYIYIPIRNGKNCLNVNILRDTYTTIASSELTVCYEKWTIWKYMIYQFKMGMSIAMLVYQGVIRNWTYIYIHTHTRRWSSIHFYITSCMESPTITE